MLTIIAVMIHSREIMPVVCRQCLRSGSATARSVLIPIDSVVTLSEWKREGEKNGNAYYHFEKWIEHIRGKHDTKS